MKQYNFSDEAEEAVQTLAKRLELKPEEVIERGLSLLGWVLKEVDNNEATILVERPTTILTLPIIGEIKGMKVGKLKFDFPAKPAE